MSLGERFSYLRQELKELQAQEIQLELDLQQHERVLETIANLEPGRKCFRLVGEVLVQSTVGEVRPTLKEQIENLKEAVAQYTQNVELKEKEIQKFQEDNKIQFASVNQLQERAKEN